MCGVPGNLFQIVILEVFTGSREEIVQLSSYLVAETLRGDDGDLIADSLVGLEVQGQLGVVPLNDDLGGLLNRLGTNATHDCGCGIWCCRAVFGCDLNFCETSMCVVTLA
jgi:hypothetical protein